MLGVALFISSSMLNQKENDQMSDYINPKDGTSKEEFLFEHGCITNPNPEILESETHMLVCLVYNGGFTAAAIVDSQYDLDCFLNPEDMREKLWFHVAKENLKEFIK